MKTAWWITKYGALTAVFTTGVGLFVAPAGASVGATLAAGGQSMIDAGQWTLGQAASLAGAPAPAVA